MTVINFKYMGHFSVEDRSYLNQLREENILEEVAPQSLDLSNGVIAVVCADGDQFFDYYSHIASLAREQLGRERAHMLALNGGALLLSNEWPDPEEAIVLKRHINVAVDLKNIHTVVLYVHAPCGAAGICHFDAKKVLDLLVQAKENVKLIRGDIKVICFVHVDWGEGKKRTYFLSQGKWNEYNK